MKKFLIFFLSLFLYASIVSAQTAPRLSWDQPNTTLAEAQALVFNLSIDGVTLSGNLVQTCTLLAAPAVGAKCVAPIPALTAGLHTLILTASNTFSFAASDPLTGSQPNKPTNVKITFTITIP